jgi:hypothetical protein
MATQHRNTCDKCRHYTKSDSKSNEYRNAGRCDLMGDSADGPNDADKCVGWDYEGYRAGVYVGPKFGCIHWEKKA